MQSVIDWFWRGSRLAQAKQESAEPTERGATLAQRAHASAELAQNVLSPNEPEEAHFEAYACELFRQSVYWSLSALAARSSAEPGNSYDAALWDSLDPQLIATSTEERREALQSTLRNGTFVQFAELPQAEQVSTCAELRLLANALLKKLDQRAELLSAIYMERLLRVVGLGVLALALVVGAFQVSSALEKRRDFAYGATWVASSQLGNQGKCTSPEQQCAEANGFFFHTNEEDNAWVEFDLGTTKTVKSVEVTNRVGCCTERAASLTVEVSTDHKAWRSVAQRNGEFTDWVATFAPTQAQWVRLRLRDRNYLHLAHVGIH